MTNEIRGTWGTFLLSALADTISICGFTLMIPQFYINYKLQSVAHMPHWTLFFRFMTAMIDHLLWYYGFNLPSVYRLNCYRDEIVFVVYIYQMMKYPAHRHAKVEKSTGEDEGDSSRKKVGNSSNG